MDQDKQPSSANETEQVAYLVVKEGNAWRDVFRLNPDQVTTVGRAPTNRIVVHDEICSRNHCEIYQNNKTWTLRDLGSRNGTLIDGIRVDGDWKLHEGERVQIGSCELGFTFDISRSFAKSEEVVEIERDSETALEELYAPPEGESGPSIIHRTRSSRYQTSAEPESIGRDRTSRDLAGLYQLALRMGAAPNAKELAEVVLDGVFSGTSADIGALLLLPKATTEDPKSGRLRVVSYKSQGDLPYQKVSEYLSEVVLVNREAVLARDVCDDSRLAGRDDLGQIHAKSVICAPIRTGDAVHGLIHLYSTEPEVPMDPDDLEFTLAVADQFAVALGNMKKREFLALGLARARNENQTLRQQLEIESELVGESSSIRQLQERIAKVAPTDATVMIRGESGVGKELVARAIHFSSHRKNKPFICMNCAALSENLLESELFGHEKGSFTGAVSRKLGKFEQAHQGTLFLDEVGEMSLNIQAKFLRVLEGHPFERVGGGIPIEVDVRVVAATNRDLERGIKEETFRKDLYFRLQVMEIEVEPLREHRDDVALLANYFLDRFSRKIGRSLKGFAPAALAALTAYDWPGNVRELQNVIERAVILCANEHISEHDIQLSPLGMLSLTTQSGSSSGEFREISLDQLEQEHILATLERTGWNKSRAAQLLGIERSTLDRKLKRYRVSRPKS
ncbi:MAG: sigma 54-interacting transcriptional regulator [Planctomycetes bacterium]|nr:sigma 54-interacting transcriptional regulator [Planctomycetota bacterium]